jgi:outer membrane receptor protein involved in Fe transport
MGLLNDNWSVTVFVNNLLDEQNAITSFTDAVGWFGESAERPRSYGLRVRYDF